MLVLFSLFVHYLLAKYPVILIPGLAGSQVEYRNGDWDYWGYLWLNAARTIPILKNWYLEDLYVNYNPSDDSYSCNVSQCRSYSFGTIDGMDHIDAIDTEDSYYYHSLIDAFEDAGYSNGKDLVGGPYDFRLQTKKNSPTSLYPNLKKLIESTVNANGGEPILAVSHSEGAAVFRYFLARFVDEDWKKQYIRGWVSGCGAFAGAPISLHYLTSYKAWGIPTLDGEDTHNTDMFWAGVFWMLPTIWAWDNDTLLSNVTITDGDSFLITLRNITEAFQRSEGTNNAIAAQNIMNGLNEEFDPADVELWLYYGTGHNTIISEEYTGTQASWWKQDGTEIYIDGDGTVPTVSQLAPTQWKTQYPLHTIEKPGMWHSDIISDGGFINDILNIAINSEKDASEAITGLYAVRREATRAIASHAQALQHGLVVRQTEIRAGLKRLGKLAGEAHVAAVQEEMREVAKEGQKALESAVLPMHAAITGAEKHLRTVVQELLAQYGTTDGLSARSRLGDTKATAALAERDRRFTEEAEATKERVHVVVEEAMAKAMETVNMMERRARKLLMIRG